MHHFSFFGKELIGAYVLIEIICYSHPRRGRDAGRRGGRGKKKGGGGGGRKGGGGEGGARNEGGGEKENVLDSVIFRLFRHSRASNS